jgi:hypothetical protein
VYLKFRDMGSGFLTCELLSFFTFLCIYLPRNVFLLSSCSLDMLYIIKLPAFFIFEFQIQNQEFTNEKAVITMLSQRPFMSA